MARKINTNALKKLIRLIKYTKDHLDDATDELMRKYYKVIEEDFEYIARSAIDHFYEGYDPNLYGRTMNLYNAYKVVVNDKEWAIYFEPEFLGNPYHQSSNIVFNVAFEHGYHGGSGKTVSESKEPWWRTPPMYKSWLGPAVGEAVSPREEIETKKDEYMEKIGGKIQADFDKMANRLLDPIEEQLLLILNGGA